MFGIDVCGERAYKLAIGCEVLQLLADNAAQALLQVAALVEDSLDLRRHLVLGLLIESHYQRVFRVEVVVGCANGYAGSGCDLAHGRCLESALAKDLEGSSEDALAGFFRFA